MSRILMVLLLLMLSVAGSAKETAAPTPPAPALTISFERQNIRQKDCVNVQLVLANNSDSELTKTSLTVSGPAFVSWFDNSCEPTAGKSGDIFGLPAVPSLALGTIPPRSILRRQLHLQTPPTIQVGEYNSLFTVEYHWQLSGVTAASVVSAEKPIKVSFLGSESVAGIPLALAGFIVPGLVFWWIVKLFRVPWSVDALGAQMIYSVLVSIAILFAGAWFDVFDVSAGISMDRLLRLVVAGLLVGGVAGGADLTLRQIRARQAAKKEAARLAQAAGQEAARLEQEIRPEESLARLLGKLLELPPEAQLNKPLIRLKKDQQQFIGALGARTYFTEPGSSKTELVSVVGSFFIKPENADEAVKASLKELRDAGQLRALVALADQNNLLETINEVQKVIGDEDLEASGESFMQWKAEDVESVAIDQEGWNEPALR